MCAKIKDASYTQPPSLPSLPSVLDGPELCDALRLRHSAEEKEEKKKGNPSPSSPEQKRPEEGKG